MSVTVCCRQCEPMGWVIVMVAGGIRPKEHFPKPVFAELFRDGIQQLPAASFSCTDKQGQFHIFVRHSGKRVPVGFVHVFTERFQQVLFDRRQVFTLFLHPIGQIYNFPFPRTEYQPFHSLFIRYLKRQIGIGEIMPDDALLLYTEDNLPKIRHKTYATLVSPKA